MESGGTTTFLRQDCGLKPETPFHAIIPLPSVNSSFRFHSFSLQPQRFLVPLPGSQATITPEKLIQISVCKYLYLHKHLCLAVCYSGNTSEASSLHKEMSPSLLTLLALHIQRAVHHLSVCEVSKILYFQLILCQQKEKQFRKAEVFLHFHCLLFTSSFYHSSFSPLADSQLPLLTGLLLLPALSGQLFPSSQCETLSLSLPTASITPPSSMLSPFFNKGCPTRGGNAWSSGWSASSGLEKFKIEFIFQTQCEQKFSLSYRHPKMQCIARISDLVLHIFNWIIFISHALDSIYSHFMPCLSTWMSALLYPARTK